MKTLVLLGLAIVVGYLMAIVYFTITDAFGEKSPARPPQYQLPQYYQYSQMFQVSCPDDVTKKLLMYQNKYRRTTKKTH